MSLSDIFSVRQLSGKTTREFIREHHYTHTCHNGPMGWGLIDSEENLQGVVAFATPCSENVRASLFGEEHKDRVTELHRLFTFDDLPPNSESWFVTRAFSGLLDYRPKIRGIISFADSTEGHVGYIYQALNFKYCGTTGSATFYRDKEGRLRHPRQNGCNISRKEAHKRDWVPEKRGAKYRYVKIIGPNRRNRRKWENRLLLDEQEYPKQ